MINIRGYYGGTVFTSVTIGRLAVGTTILPVTVSYSWDGQWRCEKCGRLLAKAINNGMLAGQIRCKRCGYDSER